MVHCDYSTDLIVSTIYSEPQFKDQYYSCGVEMEVSWGVQFGKHDVPVSLVTGQGDAGGRDIGEEPHGGGLGASSRGREVTVVIIGHLGKHVSTSETIHIHVCVIH